MGNQQQPFVLLGVPVDTKSLETLTDEAISAIEGHDDQLVFACSNSHSLSVAQRDPEFFSALTDANQVVADGVGVTIMAKLARLKTGPRIAGEQYYFSVLNALVSRGNGRVFFFGSSENVLDQLRTRFEREFPQLTLCGTLSPPFRDWSDEENRLMVEQINEANPDVLWVGMTAPKQEKWVFRNRALLNVPVIGSIGAVFDYYAQTVKSPPEWVRKAGLETPYRLCKEPRRLFYRTFISNGKFALMAMRHHIFKRH